MLGSWQLVWRLMSPASKRRLVGLVALMVCSAVVELTAVGMITRFMGGVLGANSMAVSVRLLPHLTLTVWQAAIVTLCTFALSNTLLGLNNWNVGQFTWGQEVELSRRCFEAALRMPYAQFQKRNSGTLLQEIWCSNLCQGLLASSLLMLNKSLSCLFLFLGVVYADWVSAAMATLSVVVIYAVIHRILTGPVKRMGDDYRQAQGERQRLTSEMLGAYKSVKLMQRWDGLLELYWRAADRAARRSGFRDIIIEMPRYVLETTALAGLVGMVVYMLTRQENRAFEMISLYGIAGYRILPNVHYIFRLASQVDFTRSSAEVTVELLEAGRPLPSVPAPPMRERLTVENVSVQFADRTKPALAAVSIVVARGQTVGLAGSTGSGKSTLLDVLSGLRLPDQGELLLDGQKLVPEAVMDWQRGLGLLPQNVETLDDSLAANIAFGLPERPERLEAVLRMAALGGFVAELPNGLATRVGEKGSALSSGQRQRLGLARALYHDPDFLLLDEATSSLDGKTEEALLDTLRSFKGEKTIVMAAHRPSALAICDWIYLLEDGRLLAQGTYPELAAQSPQFQQLMALED